MFTLAHLSDPHIGPIETPHVRELINKRGLGLINWYRKRHRHHHRGWWNHYAGCRVVVRSHINRWGERVFVRRRICY